VIDGTQTGFRPLGKPRAFCVCALAQRHCAGQWRPP
jgi:hypothetical protein